MPIRHCGLDFGTSNSTLGIAGTDGVPRLVPIEGDNVTVPSVLFFSFEEEATYFGRRALSEYIGGAEGRLLRSLKSVLGTALMADVTRVKARQIKFIDILGLFVAELRTRAEARAGNELTHVVVGRPVRFVDDDEEADAEAQRQLESAVRRQGFEHIEFQFEPIAAALDYERQVSREELALVVDIGGGTSDFSVLRVSPERAKAVDRKGDILSTTGVHLGGTDFDRLLSMQKVMPFLGYGSMLRDGKRAVPVAPYYDLATWHRINRLYNQKALLDLRQTRFEAREAGRIEQFIAIVRERQGHRLAGAVEDAKIALTAAPEVNFGFASPGAAISETLSRADLDTALLDAVQTIGTTIDTALRDADVSAAAIQTLILTGGSTQIPIIATLLRGLFPGARFVETDAFGSVGLGLALDASRRF